MEFEWDKAKNRANILKHGISFEIAIRIFHDPNLSSNIDRVADGEERWQSIGLIEGRLLVLAAHAWSTNDVVRVISARKATRNEEREHSRWARTT